jgi:hypothetical protein
MDMQKLSVTHSQRAFIAPVWLVHVYGRRGSRGYLARYFIEDNRNEFVGEFEVGGLEDVVWAI